MDTRYQAAVAAISGQNGWPLTAVLTPEGKPFFGGTYFPRDDRYGRPGFARVLLTMADAWKTRRDEVLESAGSVVEAIEYNENFAGRAGNLSMSIVDKMVASALDKFDRHHGGFGSQPKFAHPSAIDLLLDVAARTGNEAAREAATVTLEKMARGGVYDQLGGGFHRYSVDEAWVVPHFEKMLYDNAELLKNYVHAFQSYVDPESARVAKDIIRWMDTWLTDRERGGFYASQDADIDLDDDGDYFTWTRAEAAAVLTPEEMEIAAAYYDIGDLGDMHHNPAKNVLHVKQTLDAVAARVGKTRSEAEALLAAAHARLLAARGQRPTPFIDTTVYTSWNALAVSAYLRGGAGAAPTRGKSLCSAYPGPAAARGSACGARAGPCDLLHRGASPGPKWVAGMLDDYAFLTHACLDGWLATGAAKYYRAALGLAERMVAEFYDADRRRFFRCRGQGRRAAGSADGTAQAAAGFADAGGKSGRRGCTAAPGGAEWAGRSERESGGYPGGVCRRGDPLRALRGNLWPGARAAVATAGAGGGDWRRYTPPMSWKRPPPWATR